MQYVRVLFYAVPDNNKKNSLETTGLLAAYRVITGLGEKYEALTITPNKQQMHARGRDRSAARGRRLSSGRDEVLISGVFRAPAEPIIAGLILSATLTPPHPPARPPQRPPSGAEIRSFRALSGGNDPTRPAPTRRRHYFYLLFFSSLR